MPKQHPSRGEIHQVKNATNGQAVFQCKYLLDQKAIKYSVFKHSYAASCLHTYIVSICIEIVFGARNRHVHLSISSSALLPPAEVPLQLLLLVCWPLGCSYDEIGLGWCVNNCGGTQDGAGMNKDTGQVKHDCQMKTMRPRENGVALASDEGPQHLPSLPT
jgi:hypothetical protein